MSTQDIRDQSVDARPARRRRAVAALLNLLAGVVATAGVLGVTAAAFALSFDAIRAVAVAAHIRPSLAWLYPVAVDGAMATATVCAVVLRARGQSAAYPWLVVLFGAVVSVVANGLHAYGGDGQAGAWLLPAQWAVTLSAVPPVLLALSVHLLIVLALSVRPTVDLSTPVDTQSHNQAEPVAGREPVAAPESAPSSSDSARSSRSSTSSGSPSGAGSSSSGRRRQRPTAAQRVRRAVAEDPHASAAEVAARVGVSERTVQRYRPSAGGDTASGDSSAGTSSGPSSGSGSGASDAASEPAPPSSAAEDLFTSAGASASVNGRANSSVPVLTREVSR